MIERNIKSIGSYAFSDLSIIEKIEYLEKESANNKELTLCVALSYGSRLEIVHAVKRIAEEVKTGKIDIKDIDDKMISSYLYTRDIPDPDILIRTSGEQRVSNYLLWQLAYTEFFFTDTLWPDFNKDELLDIIKKFNNRERRYGKN